ELSLLRQLYNFNAGDPFYRPDITKFTNDLSATRYFNTVNVETILPPDELSATTTLAFDNALAEDNESRSSENENIDNDDLDDGLDNNNGSTSLNLTDNMRVKDKKLADNIDNIDNIDNDDSASQDSNNGTATNDSATAAA